ncbi:MAG TPA: site-specific integrase [Candidatus Sulfotelmatobacter sp.]
MGQREQTGHLYKAFGGWHIRYWVAYTDLPEDEKEKITCKCDLSNKPLPSRVQKSKRLCDGDVNRKAARDLAGKRMDEVNGYVPGETIPSDLTLGAYWDKHYLPWAETNLKPSTLHGYKQAFSQHLKPKFGNTPLKEIKTPSATKFLGQLAEDEQGERTITHVKWIASGIYKHAIATGFAKDNPWPDAQCLVKTQPPKKGEAYTIDEALAMIEAVDRIDAKLALALACFVGMRKGEIQVLRWEDFVGDGVRIERAMSRTEVQDETKTGKARMGLVIEPVKTLLEAWRSMWPNKPTSGWLFPNGAKKPMSLDSMAQRLIIPKLNNGLRWKGWHAGRRGCSTILTELTGDALAARDILGHSTTKITEQHYIAPIPEAGRKGMALLEARVKLMRKG